MLSLPTRYRPRSYIISPFSPDAMGSCNPTINNNSGWASAVWPAANLAILYPFSLTEPSIALSMYVGNGTVVSGNLDLGIYNAAGVRLVSSGATVQAGTSALQKVDIADTLLPAGETLYCALSCDNITATFTRTTAAVHVGQLSAVGMLQQAAAYTLPATATFASIASNYIPLFGVSFLSTY